jgi:pimeloyl-ACP methyl ester carboxylesterase
VGGGPETTSTVEINGFATRIWRKGGGPLPGSLAGFGGLPRWTPFLDRFAERRTVVVPSLPGFPGGERGHGVLDSHLDGLLATRRLPHAATPEGADAVEWPIEHARVAEAAARIFWPLGDTRPARRLPFTKAPTSLLWGGQDRPTPPSHARRFAEKPGGPNETRTMPGSVHLAGLDRPDEVARALLDWLN